MLSRKLLQSNMTEFWNDMPVQHLTIRSIRVDTDMRLSNVLQPMFRELLKRLLRSRCKLSLPLLQLGLLQFLSDFCSRLPIEVLALSPLALDGQASDIAPVLALVNRTLAAPATWFLVGHVHILLTHSCFEPFRM